MSSCALCGKGFAAGDTVFEVTVAKYEYDTEMIDQVDGLISRHYCEHCIGKHDRISVFVKDAISHIKE